MWNTIDTNTQTCVNDTRLYVNDTRLCVSVRLQCYTSAPFSPSRQSLGTALVRRGLITNDTSVCRLICVAIWRPYSTTNEDEVWALQRTKKPAGLRLSVLHHQVQQTN